VAGDDSLGKEKRRRHAVSDPFRLCCFLDSDDLDRLENNFCVVWIGSGDPAEEDDDEEHGAGVFVGRSLSMVVAVCAVVTVVVPGQPTA